MVSREARLRLERTGKWVTRDLEHQPETRAPLGEPIAFTRSDIAPPLDLEKMACAAFGCDAVGVDNAVIVFPTGLCLVCVALSCADQNEPAGIRRFQEAVEEQYSAFVEIFLEVATAVIAAVSDVVDETPQDLERHARIGRLVRAGGAACTPEVLTAERESLLLDVYYLRISSSLSEAQPNRVDYVSANLVHASPDAPYVLTVMYSAFACMLWLKDFLRVKSGELHRALLAGSAGRQIAALESSEVKELRSFVARFLQESNPIDVRLTREYMELGECCWREFRMHALSEQITRYLDTLDDLESWARDEARERRNHRIQVAAVALALLSVLSVVADVTALLDAPQTMDRSARFIVAIAATAIAVSLTYLVSRWEARRRASGRASRHKWG